MRVADRFDQLRDVRRRNAGRELKTQVDHLGAVAGRVQDAFGDRRGFAFAGAVQHANGHDPRAVGQARQPVAVVRGLGDRCRDERAVAVAVIRILAARDEVIACLNSCAPKSGERRNGPRFAYAMPVSSTATITPLPPGAPSAATLAHASGAFTPNGPTKFHCSFCQSPAPARCRGRSGISRPRRARRSSAPPTARRRSLAAAVSSLATLTPRGVRTRRVVPAAGSPVAAALAEPGDAAYLTTTSPSA